MALVTRSSTVVKVAAESIAEVDTMVSNVAVGGVKIISNALV